MGKRIVSVAMAAAIGVGGLAVAAVNPLGVAGAHDGAPGDAEAAAHPGGPLRRALDGLVADGAVTREQADLVVRATEAEAGEGRAARKEQRQARRGDLLQVVADTLGSSPEQVTAALRRGSSIAEQAEAAGIDRQAVDDALTAHLASRIDQAVADGALTERRAEWVTERLGEGVDRILDAEGGRRGSGRLRERLGERFGD